MQGHDLNIRWGVSWLVLKGRDYVIFPIVMKYSGIYWILILTAGIIPTAIKKLL